MKALLKSEIVYKEHILACQGWFKSSRHRNVN